MATAQTTKMVITAVLTGSGKLEIQLVYNITSCQRGRCREELFDEELHPAKLGACSLKPKFVLFD